MAKRRSPCVSICLHAFTPKANVSQAVLLGSALKTMLSLAVQLAFPLGSSWTWAHQKASHGAIALANEADELDLSNCFLRAFYENHMSQITRSSAARESVDPV